MSKPKRWLLLSISMTAISIAVWGITNFYLTYTASHEVERQYVVPSKAERRARADVANSIPIAPAPASSVSTSETYSEVHIEDLALQKAAFQETDTPEPESMGIAASKSENGLKESHDSSSSESSEYKDFLAKHSEAVAEYEKYQSELDASLSEIPHIADMLNSLSADEQQNFLADVKAMARDNALQAGLEDSDRLNQVMAEFLDLLIESGFEPRY